MDWKLAIEMNRAALKRVVASLVAMAGMNGRSAVASGQPESGPNADSRTDGPSPTGGCRFLPRHLRLAVLRLLRPAEAATRRLVIMAARGIVLPPMRPRPRKPEPQTMEPLLRSLGIAVVMSRADIEAAAAARRAAERRAALRAARPRVPGLPLLDPLPPYRPRRPRQSAVPRISAPGFTRPFPIAPRRPPTPDDPIDATRLALRLQALERALDDLPGHARRFARWRNRVAAGAQKEEFPVAAGAQEEKERVAAGAQGKESLVAAGAQKEEFPVAARAQNGKAGKCRRIWPLKPGLPPGARRPGSRRKGHEIDEILGATHGLAFWTMTHPDTS